MLITLVTVTYNAENTLSRTLASVERQSYKDFEHIIMDGASKDSTVDIAKKYKNRNPHHEIIIVSERDKGLYDAMNKAIAIARGKFICFLNAGDELPNENTLAIVAQTAINNPEAGVIYGDTNLIDSEGQYISGRRLSPPKHLTWKSFKNGMLVCHQAFYANTSITPKYDLTYRFSADFDWCVKIMKEANKRNMPLVSSNAVLANYLSEGMTTQNHKASLKERFNIMVKHYGYLSTTAYHLWFVIRTIKSKLYK